MVSEVSRLNVDFTPLEDFQYDQISNYHFEFMLVNHDMKVVHSPFECKDYLQDIFWCENLKKSSSVFGLKWKPGMFDITTPHFYLALNGGSEVLNTRIQPLQAFLNAFEEKLGIEPTVIYDTENEKIIVLKFSKDWTINGPMLSAYTTLIRAAGAYQEGDVMEYLQKLLNGEMTYPSYVGVEKRRLSVTLEKLAGLYEGKRPEGKWEDSESISVAHATGILTYTKFPKGTLKKMEV